MGCGGRWYTAWRILACIPVLMIPFALALRAQQSDTAPEPAATAPVSDGSEASLWQTVKAGWSSTSFVLLVLGFFACGFHVSFVGTHLPPWCTDQNLAPSVGGFVMSVIGVGNIAGNFSAGWLGGRFPHHKNLLLSLLYFLRAVLFLLFYFVPMSCSSKKYHPASGATCWSPDSITSIVLVWSTLMGILWLSSVPLTMGLVSDLVGEKWATTLFGFTFASHQLGGFFGVRLASRHSLPGLRSFDAAAAASELKQCARQAWLGGYMFDHTGSYSTMFLLCAGLGVLSTLLHLPIRPVRIRIPSAEEGGGGGVRQQLLQAR